MTNYRQTLILLESLPLPRTQQVLPSGALVEGRKMKAHLTPEELDEFLSIQLLIAWAGETPGGGTARVGWWKNDVIDEEAGGDLWKRQLPRTHRGAGLAAARRARASPMIVCAVPPRTPTATLRSSTSASSWTML
ncbi:MAG: BrxE family protein [Archangium sp.]|nr:BrxE family protein [Archangium sp.]